MRRKMKISILIVLLMVFALTHPSLASEELIITKGQTSLSIKPSKPASGCDHTVTSIERFTRDFLFQYDYESNGYYLITQRFEVGEGCFEGYDPANVSVTARTIDLHTAKVSKQIVWMFSTKGIKGERDVGPMKDLYKVIHPGCCGLSTTTKYFNLRSGRFVGSSMLQPLTVDNLTTAYRHIMVELGSSSDYMGKERGIATIYYTDGNGIKQEVVVKSPHNTSSFCDLNRLQFTGQPEYKRWYSLPRQSPFEGISFVAEVICEQLDRTIIEIPIVGDALRINKATIKGPTGIKIVDVSDKEPPPRRRQNSGSDR
jgi:hypothetical protein